MANNASTIRRPNQVITASPTVLSVEQRTPVASHLRHVFAKRDVPNQIALAAVAHHSIE